MNVFRFFINHFTNFRRSAFVIAGSVVVLSTGVKVLSMFAITKYLSVKFGPDTLALYGQSQSFINLIITFSTLSSAVGITKYLAEYKSRPIVRAKIAIAAWDLTTICSFIISILIVFFSKTISKVVFFSQNLYGFVIIMGLSTFFIAAYKTRIAILNGYYQFKRIALWEIIYNILLSLLLIGLSLFLKSTVIVSIALSYAFLFYFMNFNIRFNPFKIFERFSHIKSVLTPLSKYSFLIFIQTAIGFGFEIILRLYLVNKLSLTDLGLYEGMNKISGAVLLPITSIISIYFFPIFANRESGNFTKIILSSLKKILPFIALALSIILIFDDEIIKVILSDKFLVLSKYIFIQLFGLLFSVINLIYLNALLARGKIKLVFVLTITNSALLLIVNYFMIDIYKLKGLFISYLVVSAIGLVTYIFTHIFGIEQDN